jgi:hypothetical protein
MKAWYLTRTEAEHLVDLIESTGDTYGLHLAAELRKLFGMVTRDEELKSKKSDLKKSFDDSTDLSLTNYGPDRPRDLWNTTDSP